MKPGKKRPLPDSSDDELETFVDVSLSSPECAIPRGIPFQGPPAGGRTVSVALPASIVGNSQTPELRSYLVGQIARTCTIFGVDEIVLFEDSSKGAADGRPFNLDAFYKTDLEALKKANEQKELQRQAKEPQQKGTEPRKKAKSEEKENEKTDEKTALKTPLESLLTRAMTAQQRAESRIPSADNECDEGGSSDDAETPKHKISKNAAKDAETKAAIKKVSFKDDARNNDARNNDARNNEDEPTSWSHDIRFFATNLAYLETPQYLRRLLFPMTRVLRRCGLANPLDAPHHMRAGEWLPFREGVVIRTDGQSSSVVDVGLPFEARVNELLEPGRRITLKMDPSGEKRCAGVRFPQKNGKYIKGTIATPRDPHDELGLWFGFRIRLAQSLRQALKDPLPEIGSYDLVLGTSERGDFLEPKTFKLQNPDFK